MKLLFGAVPAWRGSVFAAIALLVGSLACSGPTPNRKRRDASDISQTGGSFGDSGGTGGFGTGGSFGTGGIGTGGISGGTGGSGQRLDAAVAPDVGVAPDAEIDAAVVPPDLAADLPPVLTPDAGVDAAVVPPDAAADLAPDVAADLAADLAPDVGPDLSPEQSGLVGYWKFDEASGVAAADSSGSGNNGTLSSGASFSTSSHFPNPGFTNPGGVTLDGFNDYVAFGTAGIPNPNQAQAISMWVNYPNLTGTHGFISIYNPGALCGLQIGIRDGNLRAWKWGGVALVSRTSPPVAGWHNIIYMYDGSNHTLIVDGVTAGTSNVIQGNCTATQMLVGAVQVGQEHTSGSIDDLRIYNRVLTASEIANISGGADPLAGPRLDAGVDLSPDGPTIDLTTGLVGHWKLDEGSGTTTADSSGNGNNGTIAGNPTWPAGSPATTASNPHSLALDGTDDQVAVGVAGFNMLNQSRTVSLWFNYTAAPTTGNDTFFSVSNRSVSLPAGAGFQIGTRTTNLAIWALGGTIYAMVAAPAPGWHHLVYTFDGTTHVMFIDGAQVGMGTAVSPNPQNVSPTEAIIGNYLNGNERFTGRLDDVRIWKDRVLTQAEISALFAGQ